MRQATPAKALMMTKDVEGRLYPTTPDGDQHCRASMTHRMVRDLVNRGSNEDGLMILIRQPAETGAMIYERIRKVRDSLGLQNRFAVLSDLEPSTKTKSTTKAMDIKQSMEKHNTWFYEKLKERNDGKTPSLLKYSDLEGLPVILILCQKGKMGK